MVPALKRLVQRFRTAPAAVGADVAFEISRRRSDIV
jgi:hypothetical protein